MDIHRYLIDLNLFNKYFPFLPVHWVSWQPLSFASIRLIMAFCYRTSSLGDRTPYSPHHAPFHCSCIRRWGLLFPRPPPHSLPTNVECNISICAIIVAIVSFVPACLIIDTFIDASERILAYLRAVLIVPKQMHRPQHALFSGPKGASSFGLWDLMVELLPFAGLHMCA